jgi:hypothetical protein
MSRSVLPNAFVIPKRGEQNAWRYFSKKLVERDGQAGDTLTDCMINRVRDGRGHSCDADFSNAVSPEWSQRIWYISKDDVDMRNIRLDGKVVFSALPQRGTALRPRRGGMDSRRIWASQAAASSRSWAIATLSITRIMAFCER